MGFKAEYLRLIDSNEFKKWEKENKNCYLTSFSSMYDSFSNKIEFWTIGFYDSKKDGMISFLMQDKITLEKFDEIAKTPGTKVDELKIDKIKIDFEGALEKVKEIKKEFYKNRMLTKAFVVLQVFEGKQVWNISFLTGSFQLINFKINSENGDLVSHELMSFTDIGKIS